MQPVHKTGLPSNPPFSGLQSIDSQPLIVFDFIKKSNPAKIQLNLISSPRDPPIERLLAIPVHLFYWVVGASAIITVALAYVNSNHPATFENIFEFVISDPIAQKIYAARYGIVLVAFLTLLLRGALREREERRKWIAILKEMESTYAIFDHIREELNSHTGYISQDLKYQLNLELTRLANATCNILGTYTGYSCHVSIKTLSASGLVQTATRCEASATARRDADDRLEQFHYQGNTAFKAIVDPPTRWQRKRGYYISNHLRLLWALRLYKNQNKDWFKKYRATLVVPITTAKSDAQVSIDNTYGFVCVDNKHGRFDNAAARLLLARTASLCVGVLTRLSRQRSS
ncbi:hypothetical protein [Undibacter mobilis]|uniref:hypothetical protein n=1 Tax=Undibacter mobilis TaxID=2292256 RepID=UPI0011C0557E|nr:hypothetical protein [Undibacter mobilis]